MVTNASIKAGISCRLNVYERSNNNEHTKIETKVLKLSAGWPEQDLPKQVFVSADNKYSIEVTKIITRANVYPLDPELMRKSPRLGTR